MISLVFSGGLTSAFYIQHSADGMLVLILVLKCGWIIAVELKPFSTMRSFTCKGVSMVLVFSPSGPKVQGGLFS